MGRVVRIFRILLCWGLSVALPLCANATDLPVAVVHAQGGVWVNGKEVPDATAIFAGDTLQTQAGAAASLDSDGSTILVKPESVVTMQKNLLTLDHGSVAVGTARQFQVKVRCLDVVPVQATWTQYEVTDVSGKIDVRAHKNDVNIDRESGRIKSRPEVASGESNHATVREGEEKSQDESETCGAAERPGGAGSTLNAKWIYAGAGGAGAIILLLLLGGGGGTKPSVSPSSP